MYKKCKENQWYVKAAASSLLWSPWQHQTCICHSLTANLSVTGRNTLKSNPQTVSVCKPQIKSYKFLNRERQKMLMWVFMLLRCINDELKRSFTSRFKVNVLSWNKIRVWGSLDVHSLCCGGIWETTVSLIAVRTGWNETNVYALVYNLYMLQK